MRRRFLKSSINKCEREYLTFTCHDGGRISFSQNLEISTNNGSTWRTLSSSDSLKLDSGEKVLVKANLKPTASTSIGTFSISFDGEVSGNIMSLLYGDDFYGKKDLSNYPSCFQGLFQNVIRMFSAKNLILPATTLANSCYYKMFSGCTGLIAAPELPATTLADYCYSQMFYGCTFLTTAPTLPATTLSNYCYSAMFYGCTNLNKITMLATNISALMCLYQWVSGVASTGTFTKATNMTSLTTGANGIPSGWTVINNGK